MIVIVVIIVVMVRHSRQSANMPKQSLRMSADEVHAQAAAIHEGLRSAHKHNEPSMEWLDAPAIQYIAPPNKPAEFFGFFSKVVPRELIRENIVLDRVISDGEFGDIYHGFISKLDGTKPVIAAKTLTHGNTGEEKVRMQFFNEAAILAQFTHPNVVHLVGVVTIGEPMLIVMEFMEFGSLQDYLQSPAVNGKLSNPDMYRMGLDIASAMNYLGLCGFVHRDLAARNVLVNNKLVCKISDFGKSMLIGSIHSRSRDKLAVRWTAPEGFNNRRFTTASDAWSFGVLLWEIFSYGERPYGNLPNSKVVSDINMGIRLPCPSYCPRTAYLLMLDTWIAVPTARPTFKIIFQRLLSMYTKAKLSDDANKEGNYTEIDGEDGNPIYDELDDADYLYVPNEALGEYAHLAGRFGGSSKRNSLYDSLKRSLKRENSTEMYARPIKKTGSQKSENYIEVEEAKKVDETYIDRLVPDPKGVIKNQTYEVVRNKSVIFNKSYEQTAPQGDPTYQDVNSGNQSNGYEEVPGAGYTLMKSGKRLIGEMPSGYEDVNIDNAHGYEEIPAGGLSKAGKRNADPHYMDIGSAEPAYMQIDHNDPAYMEVKSVSGHIYDAVGKGAPKDPTYFEVSHAEDHTYMEVNAKGPVYATVNKQRGKDDPTYFEVSHAEDSAYTEVNSRGPVYATVNKQRGKDDPTYFEVSHAEDHPGYMEVNTKAPVYATVNKQRGKDDPSYMNVSEITPLSKAQLQQRDTNAYLEITPKGVGVAKPLPTDAYIEVESDDEDYVPGGVDDL